LKADQTKSLIWFRQTKGIRKGVIHLLGLEKAPKVNKNNPFGLFLRRGLWRILEGGPTIILGL